MLCNSVNDADLHIFPLFEIQRLISQVLCRLSPGLPLLLFELLIHKEQFISGLGCAFLLRQTKYLLDCIGVAGVLDLNTSGLILSPLIG